MYGVTERPKRALDFSLMLSLLQSCANGSKRGLSSLYQNAILNY